MPDRGNSTVVHRKQQILEALAKTLEETPDTRITTAKIAASVGVSEAALYRHFPSKTKMFEALIAFAEDTLFAASAGYLNNKPVPSRSVRAFSDSSSVLRAEPRYYPAAHWPRPHGRVRAPPSSGRAPMNAWKLGHGNTCGKLNYGKGCALRLP